MQITQFLLALGLARSILAQRDTDSYFRPALLATFEEVFVEVFNASKAIIELDPKMKHCARGLPLNGLSPLARRQQCSTSGDCSTVDTCCEVGFSCCPDGGCCEGGYVCQLISASEGYGCCPAGQTCSGESQQCAEYAFRSDSMTNA
jgi:hypothetical protein